MLRNLFAAFCVALVLGATAQAGVIPQATLVANPPAVNFTTDTDYNSPPLSTTWESYVLSAATNDGSKISAFDVTLSGIFNQRWTFNADTEMFDPTASSVNKTNGDSHLTPLATSTVALAPSENNNQPSALPTAADTAARDYGVGTMLRGAWGYVATDQTATADYAYVVVPKGFNPTDIDIHVELATNPDQPGNPLVILDNMLGSATANLFCPGPFCQIIDGGGPPVVSDLGPLTADASLNGPHVPTPVSATLPIVYTGANPVVWALDSFAGVRPAELGGGPTTFAFTPTLNTATGQFDWNADAAQKGLYTATIRATAGADGSDTGLLTINVIVPEPATMSLFGLALVGLVGFARRRG